MEPGRRPRRRSILTNKCNCGHCAACVAFDRQRERRIYQKIRAGLAPLPARTVVRQARGAAGLATEFDRFRAAIEPFRSVPR